jgi:hypothetical protein
LYKSRGERQAKIRKWIENVNFHPPFSQMQAIGDDFLSDAAGRANKKRILVPGARFAPFAPHRSAFPWLRDGEYQPKRQVKNTDIPIVMNVRLPILRAR